jgi:hypothetical protein
MFNVLRFAAYCTKHPGFREELEWRVIYSPSFELSETISHEIVSIDGVPQRIYKIPLIDAPEKGLDGADIPQFFDRIIIGPTDYPIAIRDAFETALHTAGVEDPAERIVVSDIPIRG